MERTITVRHDEFLVRILNDYVAALEGDDQIPGDGDEVPYLRCAAELLEQMGRSGSIARGSIQEIQARIERNKAAK